MTPKCAEKIDPEMRLMAAPLFEGHTIWLNDSATEIPRSLTILAIFTADEMSSYVAILNDGSTLVAQQLEADNAKKQSETLVYQIFPRSIVARLNAGETDISFSIPTATILFVDMVKFSDYASALTPQEIMGNLLLVFSGLDEAIAHYERLIKIKVLGYVYMSAGGLFDREHARGTNGEVPRDRGRECETQCSAQHQNRSQFRRTNSRNG
jgi:hypothetical protein